MYMCTIELCMYTMLCTNFVAAPNLPEYEVFTKFYSKISGSLSVSTFCPHLVTEEIITHTEQMEILNSSQTEAPSLLLSKISSTLKAGLTQSFYKFLDISDSYGNIDCKAVTTNIRKRLLELKSKCNVKGNNITSGAKL